MQKAQEERPSCQIITIYLPIFREKLEKLEKRGRGNCAEAANLRKTLARIDRAQTHPHLEDGDQPFLAAAE